MYSPGALAGPSGSDYDATLEQAKLIMNQQMGHTESEIYIHQLLWSTSANYKMQSIELR